MAELENRFRESHNWSAAISFVGSICQEAGCFLDERSGIRSAADSVDGDSRQCEEKQMTNEIENNAEAWKNNAEAWKYAQKSACLALLHVAGVIR